MSEPAQRREPRTSARHALSPEAFAPGLLEGRGPAAPSASRELAGLLDLAVEIAGAELGAILLLDSGSRLRIVVARGRLDSVLHREGFEVGVGVCGQVVATGESLLVRDVSRDDRFRHGAARLLVGRSCVCAPLVCERTVRGAIHVGDARRSAAFDRDDLEVLERVGQRAVSVLQAGALSAWLAGEGGRRGTDASD